MLAATLCACRLCVLTYLCCDQDWCSPEMLRGIFIAFLLVLTGASQPARKRTMMHIGGTTMMYIGRPKQRNSSTGYIACIQFDACQQLRMDVSIWIRLLTKFLINHIVGYADAVTCTAGEQCSFPSDIFRYHLRVIVCLVCQYFCLLACYGPHMSCQLQAGRPPFCVIAHTLLGQCM